jgi:hypothetical protein
LAAALLVVLIGCAQDAGEPAADTQRVEIEGTIIQFMQSNGTSGESYLLDVPGQGYLSIAIEGRPPMMARGVVVEVSAQAEIPDDVAGKYAALNAIVESSGVPLKVVDFLL